MNETSIDVKFNESFERCVNDPLFLDKFYEIFILSSDEVKLKFQNTDMYTQKAILVTSMVYMTKVNNSQLILLAKIADRHSKYNLDIKPDLYPLWLDSLIAAAKLIDPLFDLKTEKMWRKVMQPGIDYMVKSYR